MSTFTRVQRLTCCVSLLFTTMIANAMFFRSETEISADDNQPDTRIQIGPIILSANTILISIFGSLIIVPVNLVIVQFFRKSKPKNWTKEDEEELMVGKLMAKQNKSINYVVNNEDISHKIAKQRIWNKRYPLPHWFIYIAWALATLSIALPAFFVILYSLEWGEPKSLEWLSTLLFSFGQSVVLIQPLKIIVIAAVVSILFKSFDEMDEDVTSKNTNAKPEEDEKLDKDKIIKLSEYSIPLMLNPPDCRKLEKARRVRVYEKKMWGIIKEVVFYLLFLFLVVFIAWGNKSDTVYEMNTHLKTTINEGDASEDRVIGDNVLSGHDYWKWLRDTAIPSLFYDVDYAGNPTTIRNRGFLKDMTSYRVGALRLRQARVTSGTCVVPNKARRLVAVCSERYSFSVADTRNFTIGWTSTTNVSDINIDEVSRIQKAFLYYTALDLKGLPYWGFHGTYGGGGYVAELGTSSYQALKLIGQLIEESWIDIYTRAVFLEFTVYNPNTNLFAHVNYLMEFPPTGGVLAAERVTSFMIYSVFDGVGGAVVAAQLLYCIIFLVFVVLEVIKIKNQKKDYLKEPWNYIELSVLVVSVVAISMYILREKFGRLVMSSLNEDKDAYTSYSALAVYNENIDYTTGLLVFIINLKFLKLLRFNKHVAEFGASLRLAGKELMYFFLTMFLMVMAFGNWGLMIFGSKIYSFSTFVVTCETMLSMLIGKFNMEAMIQADSVMGKIYILIFTIMCFFVLVNMLLGIITVAYEEVRQMPPDPLADHKVVQFIIDKVKEIFYHRVKTGHKQSYVKSFDAINQRLSAIEKHVSALYRENLLEIQKHRDNHCENQVQNSDKNTEIEMLKAHKGIITPLSKSEVVSMVEVLSFPLDSKRGSSDNRRVTSAGNYQNKLHDHASRYNHLHNQIWTAKSQIKYKKDLWKDLKQNRNRRESNVQQQLPDIPEDLYN